MGFTCYSDVNRIRLQSTKHEWYSLSISYLKTKKLLARGIDVLNKDCRRSISAILTWVPENVKISARPLNSIGN